MKRLKLADHVFWFVLALVLTVVIHRACEADDRLAPSDVEYVGSFQLPAWRSGVRWGYGVRALTYDAARDALVGSAHVNSSGQVAWAKIPSLGERAEEIEPFRDVRGQLKSRPEFTEFPKLDVHGGLAIVDGRLWASFHTYYAVQSFESLDRPSLISNDLQLGDPRGPYKPGPYGDPTFGQKRTSNYLFAIPKRWADAHVAGRRLGMGKGDGAGNAGNSHGPPIYAASTTPDENGVLDTVALVHYPPGDSCFPWNKCDRWEGAVWVRGTVLIAGRRGTMQPECYGTPQDCGDPCGGGKGYHCQPYRVDLLFYAADDLALSASGDLKPCEVMPYAALDLTGWLKDTCNYEIGGMALDTIRSRLYLVQQDRENPIVHVWNVPEASAPPPGPEPPKHRVVVSVDGDERLFSGDVKTDVIARAIENLAQELQER